MIKSAIMPTDSLPAVFVFSFLVGFGAVVSPGPVSTAIVSQAPRHGWRVGPLIATGHSILELLIVLLIAFGLSAGLANPVIQVIIAVLGGLMLLWMGFGMLKGVYRKDLHLPGELTSGQSMSGREMLVLGMVATISNPFWYAWWVTVAAGYLLQAHTLGAASVAAFYFGHISADFTWDTVLSAVVGGGRRWMTNRLYNGILALCGLFFLYLGAAFLLQGFRMLMG